MLDNIHSNSSNHNHNSLQQHLSLSSPKERLLHSCHNSHPELPLRNCLNNPPTCRLKCRGNRRPLSK